MVFPEDDINPDGFGFIPRRFHNCFSPPTRYTFCSAKIRKNHKIFETKNVSLVGEPEKSNKFVRDILSFRQFAKCFFLWAITEWQC